MTSPRWLVLLLALPLLPSCAGPAPNVTPAKPSAPPPFQTALAPVTSPSPSATSVAVVTDLVAILRSKTSTIQQKSMACAALELLGAIGPGAADAIQALVRMTDNPDMDVRRSASAALVTIAPDGKGLGPALLAAIYNADPSAVDRLAATMRGAPNNRAILAKIIDLAANDPDAPVRATADRALKNLSPDATPAAATQPAGG